MKKKLLLMSFAVLFCGLFSFAEKPVNVIKTYMENYTDPYYYKNKIDEVGDTVASFDPEDVLVHGHTFQLTLGGGDNSYQVDMERFHTLGAPWQLEGTLGTFGWSEGDEGQQATCWHVDLKKGRQGKIRGALTLTSGWDGFASSFDNMKVFQTTKTELPVGKFDVKVNWGQDGTGAKYTFLVVTKGTTVIPDTIDLKNNANVLGYARLSTDLENGLAGKVSFELSAATKITVGLVASFPEPEDQGYCSALGDFEIIRWVEGTNYEELVAKYNQVKNYSDTEYPTGDTPGKYSQEKWDAFVTARDAAKAIVDNIPEGNPIEDPNYKDTATQQEVDEALQALENALNELDNSLILPIKFSTDVKSYYYKVSDMRGTPDYMTVEEDVDPDDGVTVIQRLKVTTEYTQADNNIFKFVKVDGKKGFYIYSKADEQNPISRKTGNWIVVDATVPSTTWIFGTPTSNGSEGRFLVKEEATGDQMNFAYAGQPIVGFYNVAHDVGNALKFERVYLDGEVDFAQLTELVNTARGMKAEDYPTGTGLAKFSQEKWDAFVAARTNAEAVLAKEESGTATQDEVNDAVTALQTAIDELNNSMSTPFLFSNDAEDHYYLVHDKHTNTLEDGTVERLYNFWKIEEVEVDGETYSRLRYSKAVSNEEDIYKFKFVKTDDGHFNIYSKTEPNTPIVVSPANKDILYISDAEDALSFRVGRTPVKDLEFFVIEYLAQDEDGNPIYNQLNSFGNHDTGDVGVWKPSTGDDAGNDWAFTERTDLGVKGISAQELGIFVKEGRILSTDANAVLNVYSISGQKINAKRQLNAGIYIVTVVGKQGVAKVIVQ